MLAFLASPEAALPVNARVKKELQWLEDYRMLISELGELVTAINSCEKLLKHNGMTQDTVSQCDAILSGLATPRFSVFSEKLVKGLTETLETISDHKKVLCSSDIIESMFGAYKNFVSCNKMAAVTKLVLIMAAPTCKLTPELIKESPEATTRQQIAEWDKKYIGTTLYQKRRGIMSTSQKQEVMIHKKCA